MSEDNMIPIKLEFREGTLFRKLQDEKDELQRKLDEEQKAHFEEHTRFVKLEYIAMDLQKRLDIVVGALNKIVAHDYAGMGYRECADIHDAIIVIAKDALKKLEE